ncbi:MAG: zinc-binding dehydrogenase, partial [Alphaproteobacteria bacterium]|nr:zinc-binding dehydrogenase [Alphaproteobacteria bacterium]
MIEFNAAVLTDCTTERPFSTSKPLTLAPVTVAGPHAGEVLVRITAVSLCRSDLSVVTGVRAWPMPIVPGHEAAGIVAQIGAGVTDFAPGDQVVLVYQPACGICPCCQTGEVHLCAPGLAANRAGALLSGGPRLVFEGKPMHHHMGLSAFAEMALVSQRSLVKVASDLPAEIAALFGCAVMCGAGTVLNTGAVQPGESVAIIGIGGVGASAILGAKLAGAARIIAVDVDAGKLEVAKSLGATDVVHGGDQAAEAVLDLTTGGVDCTIEATGVLAGFETAYNAARRGGRVCSVGLVNPDTPFRLDIAGHVTSAKRIIGSYMGSCNPARDIPKFIAAYQAGRFAVDKLITHRMPLSDINIAL